MILSTTLAALAVLSAGLTLWQLIVGARFPLHRRAPSVDFFPGVTLLKPLKGCDGKTSECLRSWLDQQYPGPLQVIFGVASAQDPVCPLVRQLIAENPSLSLQLVVCDEKIGPNAKVSQLVQMQRFVQHDVIAVSDADVWAPRDFLSNAVAPLRDPTVGLVNSFYQLVASGNFAMRWEAFAVNGDFWSQVLQSLSLKPMDFALGAVMLMPRQQLAAIGGFRALVEHLADDYQLGNHIARNGGRILLCPVVVECRSDSQGFSGVWTHQLRWARTIRVCQPGPFFWSILGNGSLWPLLWLAVHPVTSTLVWACGCLSLRMFAGFELERRFTGKWAISSGVMALVKDTFQVAIWAAAFTGRRVTWRGVNYRVEDGGKLVQPAEAAPLSPPSG